MIILIDTREQRPLKFKCQTKRVKLNVGDYTALFGGKHTADTVFERKAIGDLFGTLSRGYTRFKRAIARAKVNGIQVKILVEGTMREVANGYFHSRRSGESIVWQLQTIKERHQVDHGYFRTRADMAKYIEKFFEDKERQWRKNGGWKRITKKEARHEIKNKKTR